MTADYVLVEHDVFHEVVLVPLPEAQACVARPHVCKAALHRGLDASLAPRVVALRHLEVRGQATLGSGCGGLRPARHRLLALRQRRGLAREIAGQLHRHPEQHVGIKAAALRGRQGACPCPTAAR